MKNHVKPLRKAMGMSQIDLAKGCQVTRQTISAIENNKYDPSLLLAFNLASMLNTTVDELFEMDEDK